MKRSLRPLAVLLFSLPVLLGVWGCADKSEAKAVDKPTVSGKKSDVDGGARQLKPDDFAEGGASPHRGAAKATPAPAPTKGTPPAPAEASNPDRAVEAELNRLKQPVIVAAAPPDGKDSAYTMDAMVGQVNGNAIYASMVFDPISEQLAALGRTQPRSVFSNRAKELISGRLDAIVADALILGEAERDLSEGEQTGLKNMMRDHQEELLRIYGTGSRSLADENAVRKTGRTINQLIEEYRQRVIVQRYLKEKLLPKINVTRKDIERYYADNTTTFNPLPGRKLRVMKAPSEEAAKRIETELASGRSFAEVASSSLNTYRNSTGGQWPEKVVSEKVFGDERVNSAMLKLNPGQHTPPIKVGEQFWFVFLESRDEGKRKTLREAQVEIEELLKRQRFNDLSQKYRSKLFMQGSFNPLAQMSEGLVSVAMSRYALSE